MASESRRFGRADRVLTSREYREVARRGSRSSSRAFVLLWSADGGVRKPRLGLTVSRRIGNAVVRNRIKRRVREWFRKGARRELKAGRLVVIARRGAALLGFAETLQQLDRQLAEVAR